MTSPFFKREVREFKEDLQLYYKEDWLQYPFFIYEHNRLWPPFPNMQQRLGNLIPQQFTHSWKEKHLPYSNFFIQCRSEKLYLFIKPSCWTWGEKYILPLSLPEKLPWKSVMPLLPSQYSPFALVSLTSPACSSVLTPVRLNDLGVKDAVRLVVLFLVYWSVFPIHLYFSGSVPFLQ